MVEFGCLRRRAIRDQLPIPEDERDYYLERKYPSFGNLVPRDLASRNAKEVCDAGYGVGPTGDAVYLDFSEAIGAWAAMLLGALWQFIRDV